ncbi:MAG TPA: ATP-binding protein, partial [Kineosporiaceae bacterium]|nr:ATP-binding protein [Kineosporiaceae bacterium]
GAARVVLDRDPEQSRRALAGIETGARSALDEMHRLLGVLRDPDAAAAPPPRDAKEPAPGLDGLPALLEGARAGGLRADLTVVGTPVPVPDVLGLGAFRVVQEALTNTLRHAAATRVDVRVRYLADAVEVEVVDDGRGSAVGTSGGRQGLGLTGMRERVALHDGELEVGPRPGGGFRVRARLPLRAGRDLPLERGRESVA